MSNPVTPLTLDQKIAAKQAAKTDWQTDQKDWEYISIPAENALGEKHDTMGLNSHYFEAGKTYLVPPKVAETIKERLAVYAKACVRVLQPRRDYVSEQQVAIGSSSPAKAVNPDTIG